MGLVEKLLQRLLWFNIGIIDGPDCLEMFIVKITNIELTKFS